jgi:hypothetical protein
MSDDGSTVFESVVTLSGKTSRCLYTKIINPAKLRIGISTESIRYYRRETGSVTTLANLIEDACRFGDVNQYEIFMVPPVFCDQAVHTLYRELEQDYTTAEGRRRFAEAYDPIRTHVPALFEAYFKGTFDRLPMFEWVTQHPMFMPLHEKWSVYEQMLFMHSATDCRMSFDHPFLDDVITRIASNCSFDFNLMSSFQTALNGHSDLWIGQHYHDTYGELFGRCPARQAHHISIVREMFAHIADVYCRIHSIDTAEFNNERDNSSTITIIKNSYDEIAIVIRDLVSNQHTCFYSFLPNIFMTTQAVGWYV